MLPKTLPDNRFLKRSNGPMPGSLPGVMLSRKSLIGAVMPDSSTGAGALGTTVPPAGGDVLTRGQADNTTCGEPNALPRMIPIITHTHSLHSSCLLSLVVPLVWQKPRGLWIELFQGLFTLSFGLWPRGNRVFFVQ